MKKAIVILGAGASFDCANNAGTPNQEWRPPLAKELFRIDQRPAFENVLDQYAGARILASELAELSTDDTFNLEQKLREYANHPDVRTRDHFNDLLSYLSHLLAEVSHRYLRTPGCYVQLVRRLLSDHPHEVSFVCLNYDTLLEQSLRLFDGGAFQFGSIGDYIDNRRQARVYKVHGSIDWHVPGKRRHNPQPRGRRLWFDLPERPWSIEVSSRYPRPNSTSALKGGRFPVLTAPLADKGPNDLVCPSDHIESLRLAISESSKFLFIGTSGKDEDLLSLLRDCVGTKANPDAVHIVAGNDVGEVSTRIIDAVPSLNYGAAYLHDAGFRDYVSGSKIDAFARI